MKLLSFAPVFLIFALVQPVAFGSHHYQDLNGDGMPPVADQLPIRRDPQGGAGTMNILSAVLCSQTQDPSEGHHSEESCSLPMCLTHQAQFFLPSTAALVLPDSAGWAFLIEDKHPAIDLPQELFRPPPAPKIFL
jgi:hypothetical protein